MNNTSQQRVSGSLRLELRGIVTFIVMIWVIFLLDRFLPLERFALTPRQASGIPGILLSPFLPKGLGHITSNTVPLTLLLLLLAGSRADSKKVVLTLILMSGTLLWLFGRPIPVVGASGLVFGLIGFMLASGFFERRPLAIVVGGLVGFTYGSTVFWGILPGQKGISWDGHLYGVIAGVVCAWIFARAR